MPAARISKHLALDSNILIDLAGEEDYAHTFREEFQQRGYSGRREVKPLINANKR
jgi:hypothetical protein